MPMTNLINVCAQCGQTGRNADKIPRHTSEVHYVCMVLPCALGPHLPSWFFILAFRAVYLICSNSCSELNMKSEVYKCTARYMNSWADCDQKWDCWLHLQFCQIFRCVGSGAREWEQAWATKWTQPCLRRGWHLRLLCQEGIRWRSEDDSRYSC